MTAEELRRRAADRLRLASVAYGQGTYDADSDAAALVDGVLAEPGDEEEACAAGHRSTATSPSQSSPGGNRKRADGVRGEAVASRLEALLRARIEARMPAAHLTGRARFAGELWRVPAGVVIPRSPIAEVLANGVSPWLKSAPGDILDLCCGTGCLGMAAARVFPEARVDLADVDVRALSAARSNLEARPELDGRVRVVASDLFGGLGQGRRYDLVICNPPYVPSAELALAPPEFRHEPRAGLDGGEDGLDTWRRIVAGLGARLRPGGVLLGECGGASAAFEAAFPDLGAIWLDLDRAEPQADGTFGVFVALA